ncbi:hypothetical protein F5884DRAFT_744114 [Xylogone sp. PMI_703]|nr:hypothetical protein F5884DRAFT_744114 [Xylogone sp. PMI_703]
MDRNYSQQWPKLGATFYPGGTDDYYMPVVSPTPQRIMPEVPSNIQEGLAHLELEANNPKSIASRTVSTQSSLSMSSNPPPGQRHSGGSGYGNLGNPHAPGYGQYQQGTGAALPSPFPKPRNVGPNVPPSDEEKETVLERARASVVSSTNPESQLDWAQDALVYVEIAQEDALRNQPEGVTTRPVTPRVEHELREDAIGIVTHLANQGHPKAEFMVATWFEFAKFGYPEDKREAFEGYVRSAGKGYARAEYRLGMQFEEQGDMVKAIEHYKAGLGLGDSAAHYRMGMMTMLGQHHQPQDWRRGIDLIRFAADTADENAPQGAYVYGMLLARELPNIDPPDEFLAYDLYGAKQYIEKAAYLGFAKAQLKMAQAYELCQLGCEFDPTLSLHYSALAARQGEAEADMAISKWFLCGYEGVFDKNEELAFIYAKRAAQTNMSTAEFAIGYFYEVGIYVPVDLEEARVWYQKAADHGNPEAIQRVESIVGNRTLSKTDHEEVALTRIKSRYGSQRGARPSRFKERLSSLPPTSEEQASRQSPRAQPPFQAPEIRHADTMPTGYRPQSSGRGGPAPYPDDAPMAKHGSAPYPDDHGPYYNPNLKHLSGPLADRPSSAFGIVGHGNNGPASQVRPSSSMSNLSVQDGRGGYGGGRGQNPNNMRGPPSPGFPPRGGPPSPGFPPRGGPPSPGFPPRGPSPGHGSRPGSQQSSPRAQGYGRQGEPGQDLYPAPLKQQQAGRPERLSSLPNNFSRPTQGQQPGRPERTDSMPRQQGPGAGSRTSSGSLGGPPGHAQTAPAAPAAAPKPTKGPATFEEMGIPTAKQENECLVM